MTKNEIKYLKSLLRKKNRLENKQFIIDGLRIVDELLKSSHPYKKIWVSKNFLSENNMFADRLSEDNCEIIEGDTFSRVLQTQSPQEIMALVPINQSHDSTYNSHLLVLDEISDPGNMGTILRSAAWFGINQILCSPNCVDAYNPKTVRSAMGAHFYLDIHTYNNFDDYLNGLKQIKNNGISIIGAYTEGVSYKEFPLEESRWAMIMGSEADGINPKIEHFIDKKISIPQGGKIESLNVGVAASILMDRIISK